MRKRLISLLLVLVTVLGMFPTAAFAASSETEALGEVDIYNGGYKLSYLSINGRVREQIYTYYNYVDANGRVKEIPAYCVNPNDKGVPQSVPEGESIKYLADEKASDPKVTGIVANGYPNKTLGELGLENKYQAYYATKMALWCYLLGHWDIANLKVNPNLTGVELQRAQKILAAANKIYRNGTAWTENLEPNVTCTPDREVAYEVTVAGKQYKQQIFTFWSQTWVCDYTVNVAFTNPDSVPTGTRIVDMNNNDITAIKTEATGDGYAGKFKVLYPVDSIAGQTGGDQLSFSTNVYQYAIFYASCAEVDKYGQIQNYMIDSDPTTQMRLSTYTAYGDEPEIEMETGLRILKYETGTTIPISGALFEVIGPNGDTIGTFSSNSNGEVRIPLNVVGNHTVIERASGRHYLLGENTTQNVTVVYGEVAEVTFYNDPYGSLRVEKKSDTGDNLPGAVIQAKHIESGQVYTKESNSAGVAIFSPVKPGAYEIRELSSPLGWECTDTVLTTAVVAGETTTETLINKELPGLRIVKYDRIAQKSLPDVTFEIWHDGELYGRLKTDEFGEILIRNAEPGTWLAFECETGNPDYVLDTTPQQIELTAGDGIRQLLFFNDKKPGLLLTKVDSKNPSKVIAGAVFEIKAVDGSFGPEEFVTRQDGTIDLSALPADKSYVVTEKSCNGYVIDEAQRIIHLDPNENAEFVFTNTIKPTLRILKLSADGTPLEGVSFRISYIEDGTRYLDRVTNEQGMIEISNMDVGVLSVQETSTVSDHILDLREYHVQLFPGKTSELVVENQKRPNLTIWKYDADDGVTPVEGATFLVEYADGHSIAEVTTGPDGSAIVENLLPSVVKITEKSVPSPYLLDAEPQLATLYPNRDRDVYFYNHKAPTINIVKEDSITHERLSHVKFRVWYASNKTSSGEYRDLGVFVTDENGTITLSRAEHGLEDGWFRVQELEPKTGYAIKGSDTQEAFVQSGKSKTFLFENTPLSAIIIWKFDNKTSQPVSANFQIRYLGGTSGTGGTVIGNYTTSPVTGTATVTGLKAGTYIIEEVAVNDDGYVTDSEPQTVYVSGEEQDVIQVYFGNSPKGALLITKKSDTGEPLGDVEFTVTDSTGALIGDANGKFWTSSTGEILIEGINPGTTLVVTETGEKVGYVRDDVPQTAVIRAGQTVTLEFINAKKGNLVIQKYGLKDGEKIPLEGVEFELKYSDGSYVDAENGQLSSLGRYFTNKNGQIIISHIVGTVIATEVASVPGFTIDPETRSQTVIINAGGDTQTLHFYNNAVGGVELTKVREDDTSVRIPDVTFEIRRAGDDALMDTITTDSNGRAFLALEDGDYYAVETACPDQFKLDDTRHYFEVKDGGTTPLRVTNRAFSGIKIHKTSATTGEAIHGATFLLYDANHNPIDQATSDQNGFAYFDDLPGAGRYYLRELENEGYVPDNRLKTVYVKAGATTLVEWENTPICGQIQIIKKSADDNPINGLPAGTLLEGAVFEIYDKAGNKVDTIRSSSRGLAVSKLLPLSRYTIREVSAPANYSVNPTVMTAYLEYEGQIVTFEVENDSVSTGVSIKKTGYNEVMPGQPIKYTITGVGNTSTVALSSFYWRDTLPGQVTLTRLVTGTYNQQLSYKIVYKTNLSGDSYRTLADNLSTTKNYVLDTRPAILGLAANEKVTEFMFVFGTVKAGFGQVETPCIYGTVASGLSNGSSIVNVADVGGLHNGQWIMAVSRWLTTVYAKTNVTLPKTGY